MDTSRIERLFSIWDTKKTDTLLIGLGSESFRFLQSCLTDEWAVHIPIDNDILSNHRTETGDMLQ